MKEVKGNLWTYPSDWRCITTNGFVKKNGECVMGRGCAKEARDKFPGFSKELGTRIKNEGNHVFVFNDQKLFTFPVKHNWWEIAGLDLIKRSVTELGWYVGAGNPKDTFLMPRPGCGNGGLKWEDVKPLLQDLPDNVLVISFEGEE